MFLECGRGGGGLALRLCMESIAPAPKDKFVSFPLPEMNDAMDSSTAASSVLITVSLGRTLTSIEGTRVVGLSIATDALWS